MKHKRSIIIITMFIMLMTSVVPVFAEEAWNPELDPAASLEGEEQELKNGKLSIEVTYTNDIEPKEGDTFQIIYQIVGSDQPATITLNAEEINGYVGEIEMHNGIYEILEIEYTGSNPEIISYAITNGFTVTDGGGDTIELAIGADGAFAVSGQDGYLVHIGEKDMAEETPIDETDEEIEEKKSEKEQEKEQEEIEIQKPSSLQFILLVGFGILVVIVYLIAKRKGLIHD